MRRPVAERIAPEDALLICFLQTLRRAQPVHAREGKWQGLKDYIDLPGVYVAGRLDATARACCC